MWQHRQAVFWRAENSIAYNKDQPTHMVCPMTLLMLTSTSSRDRLMAKSTRVSQELITFTLGCRELRRCCRSGDVCLLRLRPPVLPREDG